MKDQNTIEDSKIVRIMIIKNVFSKLEVLKKIENDDTKKKKKNTPTALDTHVDIH